MMNSWFWFLGVVGDIAGVFVVVGIAMHYRSPLSNIGLGAIGDSHEEK